MQHTAGLGSMAPDFGGYMNNANAFAQQASAGIRNPNDINFNPNYTPTQFSVGAMQMTDPFAGYTGGQGMSVNAPGGISGRASDYQVGVDQVSAPDKVQFERISGLPQVRAQQLQQYQMGPYERVNAPGGIQSFDISRSELGPGLQAGSVGTQSWTTPGTSQQYMSPYMQDVLDVQKAAAQRDYNQQITGIHADAARTGNFGGSRQAIMDATANRDLQDRMAQIQATGMQQAYQQGQQQFNTEQQLGLGAQQFNVQSGLQAGTLNQQQAAQIALANQQARLQAQGLGTNTNLQAQLANQQAGLTTGTTNLNALLQTQGLGAQMDMQGQLANQQMAYQQALANQNAGLQAGMFNNQQAMQAQQLNQAANLQAGLAAQQMGLQGATSNAQLGLQSQLANQQAREAQLQRQYGALGQQYGGNLQSGLQTQQLGLQAQQYQNQANQFGAGLNLQAMTAQEQARQALMGQNLGYLGFMGQQNQQMGNWAQQGFNNQLQSNTAMSNAATLAQTRDQAAADRAYQYWQQQQQFPYKQIAFGADIASRFPAQGGVSSTSMGQQQVSTPNTPWWQQVIGMGMQAAGAAIPFLAKGGLASIDQPKKKRPRRPQYMSGLAAAA